MMVAIAFVACSTESDFDQATVSLDTSELTLRVGEVYQFHINYDSTDGVSPVCFWGVTTEEDETPIAEVDERGRLTAMTPGATTVRVGLSVEAGRFYLDPKLTATCRVTILP